MSNKNKFRKNHRSQLASDSKEAKVKDNLNSIKMDNFTSYVKKVARQLNYSNDVLDFIENSSKWSKPTPTPDYALMCVAHKNSGKPSQGKFQAIAIMQHWSLGEIAVSYGRPYIYPGHKKIYFPVRYLTADRKLYREIVFFSVKHEPTQQEVIQLYTALIFITQYGDKQISAEAGWNSSFLFRSIMDALRAEILKRQLAECNERLDNIVKKGVAL